MEQKQRKTWLAVICIIACFGVIYDLVFGYRFFDAPGSGGVMATFVFFLSKMAAPLFFMVCGILLLPGEDSYKKIWQRILRVAMVLVVMSVLYYAWDCFKNGESFRLTTLVAAIFQGAPGASYGLLYCYLSILVMLPILQRLVAGMERRDFHYYFAIAAAMSCALPIVRHLIPVVRISSFLHLTAFSAYIGLMLAGLYMERYLQFTRRGGVATTTGVVVCTAISVLLTRLDPQAFSNGTLFYDNCIYLPISLGAVCAFYLFLGMRMKMEGKAPDKWTATLQTLGRYTFCVYLFAGFIIEQGQGLLNLLTAWGTPYFGTLAYGLGVYALGLLLAAVLTRVPVIKKFL